ncbi:MAG: lipoyl(octanoyl) transferase LipB [Gemmatimonadota bacterium]|nr:lipoyl(octanoyl) transferase LipB [Gemmatimonadota bacterium]
MTERTLLVVDLGLMPFAEALEVQRAAARARISGELAHDLLILVEHPPVVTLGRSSKAHHLLASAELLASRGVELFEVERGGDVTFHGPGQLVGYPIVDLKRHKQDLHWYLRQVEEGLIRALAPLGVSAERRTGLTGVWTQGRKLASIGVHARDWVTWHGFALNVTTDLSYFDLMVPCGIADVQMTSIGHELLASPERQRTLASEVRESVTQAFADVFQLASQPADAEWLARLCSVAASALV